MSPRAPSPPPPPPPHQQTPDAALSKSKAPSIQAPSVTQSNEADDERSDGDDDDEEEIDDDLTSMGPDSSTVRDVMERPVYEGEDTRYTSDNELRGFFMYGWAAEVGSCLQKLEWMSIRLT